MLGCCAELLGAGDMKHPSPHYIRAFHPPAMLAVSMLSTLAQGYVTTDPRYTTQVGSAGTAAACSLTSPLRGLSRHSSSMQLDVTPACAGQLPRPLCACRRPAPARLAF